MQLYEEQGIIGTTWDSAYMDYATSTTLNDLQFL